MSRPAEDFHADDALAVFAAQTGLAFPGQRRNDFLASARRAMRRRHLADPGAFAEQLSRDRELTQELVTELAVHESYFFREPGQFQAIRDIVLPRLRAERPPAQPLQLWSAGCARGEEAYSLAILLEQEGLLDRARIRASDLSRAALRDAAQARYSSWAFRGASINLDPRYFRKDGADFRLAPRIRDRVRFSPANLVDGPYTALTEAGGFDLVLCRNVLIYFEPETIRRVARWLFDALHEGGWLVTAPADPPLWDYAPFETQATAAGVIYRRPARAHRVSGAHDAAAPPLAKPRPPAPTSALRRRSPAVSGKPAEDAQPAETAEAVLATIKAVANARGSAAAEALAAQAVMRHPTSPDLRYLRAMLLVDLRRDDEAVAEIRRVLFLDRGLVAAHLLLGSILRRRQDLTGAARAFRAVVRLCADLPPDAAVALAENESAGRLAEIAASELASLPSTDSPA